MSVSAIIVLGGKGRRMNSPTAKQYLDLAGKPVVAWTIGAFERSAVISSIVLVVPQGDVQTREIVEREGFRKVTAIIEGGPDRQDSVRNGLGSLPEEATYVAVHDGVRPLITVEDIGRTVQIAMQCGAAVLAAPSSDTLKVVSGGVVTSTPDRGAVWRAQTPQVFRRDILERAYNEANQQGHVASDDSALVERSGVDVALVPGSEENLKITTQRDLTLAGIIIKERKATEGGGSLGDALPRVGIGYDAHRFREDTGGFASGAVTLGGVRIPSAHGLEGHSDADVLVHAVMDAVLGASGGPDIGALFPNTDATYRGISSLNLAEQVRAYIEDKGFRVMQIDATIIAETPRISPHRDAMADRIASAFGLRPDSVCVKATTNERMGFIGRGEGIAAMAVATLQRR